MPSNDKIDEWLEYYAEDALYSCSSDLGRLIRLQEMQAFETIGLEGFLAKNRPDHMLLSIYLLLKLGWAEVRNNNDQTPSFNFVLSDQGRSALHKQLIEIFG
jgi:hypothetical protein